MARLSARLTPGFLWRRGLKSAYGWEQYTFWRSLRHHLKRGAFDVLHVQDPMLAWWCRRERAAGRLRTREILAHGTEEPAAFRAAFPFLQELAPWHLERLMRELGLTADDRPGWTALPNFVDTALFHPPADATERAAARRAWGVPEEAFVIGSAVALKRDHKRVDCLIEEVSRRRTLDARRLVLLVAGAETPDTPGLRALAKDRLGESAKLVANAPRDRMPTFYQCLDVFVLPSLFEMMPIAVLEALASGVPVIANAHPVLRWMIGEASGVSSQTSSVGGMTIEMKRTGALAEALGGIDADWIVKHGQAARAHACATFAREVVVAGYLDYYRKIMSQTD